MVMKGVLCSTLWCGTDMVMKRRKGVLCSAVAVPPTNCATQSPYRMLTWK